MKLKRLLYTGLFGLMALSCGKDDPKPPIDENNAPQLEAKTFSVNENITDTHVIGTVEASDDDGDDLEFSISTNDNGLFEIGKTDGKLSLAVNKSLDYASKQQHTITVSVSDGELSANADMTINVTEAEQINESPTFDETEYSFSASEDILDMDIIGAISATDPDQDDLAFTIVNNDNGLFEVDATTGDLSLTEGMALDFETAEQHTVIVGVSDGTNPTVEVQVTITVTDVAEAHPDDKAAFVTTWFLEANESLVIGTDDTYTYDYTINWGDGILENRTDQNPSHEYQEAGYYTVAIQGNFPAIKMGDILASAQNLQEINQWGAIVWKTMEKAFEGCQFMTYEATDVPDLSQVTNTSYMFYNAKKFNGDIGDWIVNSIEDMEAMFMFAEVFNQDLDSWIVTNVTNMRNMFWGADDFNGNITSWNVSNVQYMNGMFAYTDNFDQNIGLWGEKTGNVILMNQMFQNAKAFNRNLGTWDVAKVTSVRYMFSGAQEFSQNLGNWNITAVTNMEYMLDDSGMSPANYGNTLIGWSNQPNHPQNITLGAANVEYCQDDTAVQGARDLLVIGEGWTIEGDEGIDCEI